MRTIRWIVLLSGVLVLLGAASAPGDLKERARLSLDGLGPVRIGATVAAAERHLGHSLRINRNVSPGCGTGTISKRLKASVLVTGSRIAVVSVDGRPLSTDRGVHVGDSVAKLKRRYQHLRRFPEFYSHLPAYAYRRGNRKLLFFTRRGRVTSMSAGRRPEVDYVEGCA